MQCEWNAFLNLLPPWIREDADRMGKENLQELRLRIGGKAELKCLKDSKWLPRMITEEDISYCVNAASRYSPWAASSVSRGYITARGGHRLGLCGDATVLDGTMKGYRSFSSVCLRVARDFPGIGQELISLTGSSLIIGVPGCGKTTLLRDFIRMQSDIGERTVSVVDERGELFPYGSCGFCFPTGKRTDVLTGCEKLVGINVVLRNMTPEIIAVDEITAGEDCTALLQAGWCGVDILATAHASSKEDLFNRKLYQPIVKSGLFQNLIVLQKDKSYRVERMGMQ